MWWILSFGAEIVPSRCGEIEIYINKRFQIQPWRGPSGFTVDNRMKFSAQPWLLGSCCIKSFEEASKQPNSTTIVLWPQHVAVTTWGIGHGILHPLPPCSSRSQVQPHCKNPQRGVWTDVSLLSLWISALLNDFNLLNDLETLLRNGLSCARHHPHLIFVVAD